MKKQKCTYLNMPGVLKQLSGLAIFGHQTACLFAMTNFPDVKASSRKTTAARAITALESNGLIRGVVNATGSTSLILTAHGAALWNAEYGDQVRAMPGEKASISGPTFRHRQIATAYLASQMNDDDVMAIIGEFEMIAGTTPLNVAALKKLADKLPDGLIIREIMDQESGCAYRVVEWVEVESAFKKPDEIQKILGAAIELTDRDHVLEFDRPFYDLNGKAGGQIRLTIVVQETDIGHFKRLKKAMAFREENLSSRYEQEKWERVKELMRVAVVPLKRYSATLNGVIEVYTVGEAEQKIEARLLQRARDEMTDKECQEVARRKASWIADFDARNAAKQARGQFAFHQEVMPDFGYEVRRERPMSRRLEVDFAEPTRYPEIRRRRVEMPSQPSVPPAAG